MSTMTSNHPQKPEHESGDIRVMIIGDSISQGREGDWTWRYRIWEWFRQEGIHTTFVGPYKGTVPPDKPEPPRPPPLPTDPPGPPDGPRTTGGYAAGVSPDFLSNPDHYSTSGWQAAQAKDRVADQVAIHQPDICLVELGFNDLGWFVGGPDETLANIKAIVDRARVAKPNLKFAIADVPQRTAIPGRDELPYEIRTFNWLLARAIPIWSTDESPIGLAAFCDNYSCGDKTCKASYDGLHPNALGEYQLAQAFSRALIAPPFSFGQHELAIPPSGVIPLRPTPTPANFSAVATPAGVTVTWDSVYGAIGYELRVRLCSSSSSFLSHYNDDDGDEEEEGDDSWPAPLHLSVPRHDTTHCVPNQRWEYQVRTTGGRSHIGNCGRPLKSPWSKIASAVAHPETAPGPVNIQTHATEDGFSISWDAPPFPGPGAHHQANKYEIDRYGVIILDSDAPGSFPMIVGVPGDETSAEMRGLVKGHCYSIAVETWTVGVGGGLPRGARAVVVGIIGRPLVPVMVEVVELVDETSVVLRWRGDGDRMAGYRVWVRELALDRGLDDGGTGDREYLADSLEKRRLVCEVPSDMLSESYCRTLTGLRPSVFGYEFAVSAYNGSDESGLSEWVRVPEESKGYHLDVGEGDCLAISLKGLGHSH